MSDLSVSPALDCEHHANRNCLLLEGEKEKAATVSKFGVSSAV
jgi:hypothetical protein